MKCNKVKLTSLKTYSMIVTLCALLFPCLKISVIAAELDTTSMTAPMIVLESYEVTNEHIIPGEEFTLDLVFKNFSPEQDANAVVIDVSNPPGIMPVYGSVSQVYIDAIPAGETRKISIDYIADKGIDSTYVDFAMTVVIGSVANNYVSVRVPAGMDSPFSVLSANFPLSVVVGEKATSSLTFEVLGDENVRNVAHVVSVDGQTIGSTTIGILTPGTTKTQNTTVEFSEPGTYAVDIIIQYVDKTEQLQTFLVDSKEITVHEIEAVSPVYPQADLPQDGDNTDKIMLLGIGGVIILLLLVAVVVISKKNK